MTCHELLSFCETKVSSAGWVHTQDDRDRLGFDKHRFVTPKLDDCYCELILGMGDDHFRMTTYGKVTDGVYVSKDTRVIDYYDAHVVRGELLLWDS